MYCNHAFNFDSFSVIDGSGVGEWRMEWRMCVACLRIDISMWVPYLHGHTPTGCGGTLRADADDTGKLTP